MYGNSWQHIWSLGPYLATFYDRLTFELLLFLSDPWWKQPWMCIFVNWKGYLIAVFW